MKTTKYQVFLSSTYSDLEKERESIIKAILEMYHIPIGMEMFSAEDEDQWEIIRRTIEVSDYYVLVLGLRYGSKASDGISFTQKEYEYALEKKIPILAFVMDEELPLSKDRRDDDLTEIRSFRKSVLQNSKMAQFWKTKDELIKNVSISLMKQIMQKPGIGWVRGDNAAADEALLNELTILSKENRELREKIIELESKISSKVPKLAIEITHPIINEKFRSAPQVSMPRRLDADEIEACLLEYITSEDIENYNNSIPDQGTLDRYNAECDKIYKISGYSMPLVIEVMNSGSAKANNIFIDIEFPEGMFVYEKNKKFRNPESVIPINPIETAKIKYEKEMARKVARDLSSLQSRIQSTAAYMNQISALDAINLSSIQSINRGWWTKINGQKLTIKIDNLLHTRYMKFDEEYMIAPLASGKHIISMNFICEEFDVVDTKYIEMEI